MSSPGVLSEDPAHPSLSALLRAIWEGSAARRRSRARTGVGNDPESVGRGARRSALRRSPRQARSHHPKRVGVVPAGDLLFLGDTGLQRFLVLEEREREFSKQSEILSRMPLSDPAAILIEGDVENPMQIVFDTPVTAHELTESLRVELAVGC